MVALNKLIIQVECDIPETIAPQGFVVRVLPYPGIQTISPDSEVMCSPILLKRDPPIERVRNFV